MQAWAVTRIGCQATLSNGSRNAKQRQTLVVTQDVPKVALQAHRYRCSTSTVVSIRDVVIYSSLTGSGLRLSNKYMDGYLWFVSTQSKFTGANKGG